METTEALKKLLKIVEDLRKTYANKKFTLDGRLVGDLGEVIVEQNYDVKLFEKVVPKYDGQDSLGRNIQIKATFHNTLGFPCNIEEVPDYYIGIKIFEDGSFEEIYNGLGSNIWELIKDRKRTKNSLHALSIISLQKANKTVKKDDKIKIRKHI
mgnify:CR=1 FL=1